jgi:hypothetical protein
MKRLSNRNRQVLAGLFLSKFDRSGLDSLGFSTFTEAFNAIGYALGGKPASIKNYMQEFDPIFPNGRKGWHKRPLREHCREIFEEFNHLSMPDFVQLISPLLLTTPSNIPEGISDLVSFSDGIDEDSAFSKRLITGAAAEGFFESTFREIPEFNDHTLTNVSRFGCGFDFQVTPPSAGPFLAVEVKGISGESGEIMMTPKEHSVANHLGARYYLCIVRNFIEKPVMDLIRHPIQSHLNFAQRERIQTTVTWHATITKN